MLHKTRGAEGLNSTRLDPTSLTTGVTMDNVRQFSRFADFYPYYLAEHGNSTCRRLHFIGTSLVIFRSR